MTKGERIKHIREKRGISQVALADMIGVSKQTLYKYENDIITNIPSSKIEAIAFATGTTPWYLMGWDDIEDDESIAMTQTDGILIERISMLNRTGRDKVLQYVSDLLDSGKYRR